ncbi:MAG: hypothetical protein ACRD2J_05910 [Thermoanaerobaculia bacterium]
MADRPLKPLAATSGDLVWAQASAWRRDCELRDGSDVVATLRWARTFQATALGESAHGHWRLKLEGFLFKQWVRVEPVTGVSSESAVFRASPSFNGILEYGDGRSFYWDSNFWLTKWIWTDGESVELIRAERSLSLRTEGSMRIDPGFVVRPEAPLLALLGWYLIMLLTDVRPG